MIKSSITTTDQVASSPQADDSTIKIESDELKPSIETKSNTDGQNGSLSSSTSDVGPTEWDMANLRRVGEPIPLAVFLVAISEMGERFIYRCMTGPMQNYIQNPRNDELRPGALGKGQSVATAVSYFFTCWCYATPILGAIVADTYLGRYKTICCGTCIALLGILILFVTSLPDALDHGTGMPGLLVALIVIGLGFGGIKSNVGPLIAEQNAGRKPYIKEDKAGKRVLVDPNITVQSVYNIYYWMINFGALSGFPATWLELKVDFWATYLMATCFCCLAIAALVAGRNKYVLRPPSGSVIIHTFRACLIGLKHRDLNAARPSIQTQYGKTVPWDEKFVEEMKRALLACKVFAIYPIFWVCYGQTNNNLVSQAGSMNTHGAPNDMFGGFSPVCIILFVPLVRQGLYPFLQRLRIPFGPIARISVGFLMATLCMAYSTGLQSLIYHTGPCYDHPLEGACSENGRIPNNVSAFAIIPAYMFAALAEIFAYITGMEYAFTKAPASMKSLVIALYLLACSIGSLLGITLSPTSENPKVFVQFASLTGVMFITTVSFYFGFSAYDRKEDEMGRLEEEVGHSRAGPSKEQHGATPSAIGLIIDEEP